MTNHSRTTLFSVPNATSKDFLDTVGLREDACVLSTTRRSHRTPDQGRQAGPPICKSSGPPARPSAPSGGGFPPGQADSGDMALVLSTESPATTWKERLPGPPADFPRRCWRPHYPGCVTRGASALFTLWVTWSPTLRTHPAPPRPAQEDFVEVLSAWGQRQWTCDNGCLVDLDSRGRGGGGWGVHLKCDDSSVVTTLSLSLLQPPRSAPGTCHGLPMSVLPMSVPSDECPDTSGPAPLPGA